MAPPSSDDRPRSRQRKPVAPDMRHAQRPARRRRMSEAPGTRPRVNLALQGGGSHGAFTWGVLDRLLEDDGVDLAGISGTSSGALNGAVMLTGYIQGLKQGSPQAARAQARTALHDFWRDVSQHGPLFSPLSLQANGTLSTAFNFDQLPAYQWMNVFMRAFSPYEFNPLNLNPLQGVLKRHVDTEALHEGCARSGIPLFVTATAVHSGQPRVFTAQELSLDALMASACLPFLFQAIEIEGEPYWDGGYTGNPSLHPLIYQTELSDILLVRLTPLHKVDTPTHTIDIIDRLSEIAFNASLVGELRAIASVNQFYQEQRLDLGKYKRLHMHMVADDEGLTPFNASSKFNTDWSLLQQLHALGRTAADTWLAAHRDKIGVASSFDINSVFLHHGGQHLPRKP